MFKSDKFIFCIFSYNRLVYLKNLISSIDRFYPEINVRIYDDNSDDDRLLEYYEVLQQRQNFEIIITAVKEPGYNSHGSLYALMNLALNDATQNGYAYAFFIQDDMQFVQRIDLPLLCKTTFKKWQNALMVSPLFMQKIYLPQIEDYIEKKNEDLLFKNHGIADAGIIHLRRALEKKLVFDSRGETYTGRTYFQRELKVILCYQPCLAWVPWVFSYKNKRRTLGLIYRDRQLFLKPLSKNNREKLMVNKHIPFLEDFTSATAHWLPKPYYYSAFNIKAIISLYTRYFTYVLLKKFKNG